MSDTKKKGRLFDLPETKGVFQLKAIVTGMDKDKAYKEIRTKSNREMRMLISEQLMKMVKHYILIFKVWNRRVFIFLRERKER